MVKLLVGGFPLDTTEFQLATLIAPLGHMESLNIIRDEKTGKCMGYALIGMLTEEGALKAIAALNGTFMEGRELAVVSLR